MTNRALLFNILRAYASYKVWIDRFDGRDFYVYSVPGKSYENMIYVFGIVGLWNGYGYGNFGSTNPTTKKPLAPSTPVKCKFSWSFTLIDKVSDIPSELIPGETCRDAWFRYTQILFETTEQMRIQFANRCWDDPAYFPEAKKAAAKMYQDAYKTDWEPWAKNSNDPEFIKQRAEKTTELKKRWFLEKFLGPVRKYHPKVTNEKTGEKTVDEYSWKKSMMFSAECFKRLDDQRDSALISKAADRLRAFPVLREELSYGKPPIKVTPPDVFLAEGTKFYNERSQKEESGHYLYTPPILVKADGKPIENVEFGKPNLRGGSAIACPCKVKLYDGDEKGFGFKYMVPHLPEIPIKIISMSKGGVAISEDENIDYGFDDYDSAANNPANTSDTIAKTDSSLPPVDHAAAAAAAVANDQPQTNQPDELPAQQQQDTGELSEEHDDDSVTTRKEKKAARKAAALTTGVKKSKKSVY